MAVRISGDFDHLDDLIARVRAIASPVFNRTAILQLTRRAKAEIEAGFALSADPYDHAWAPLKAARTGKGGRKRQNQRPLDDTGRMRRGFRADKTATGFTVRNDAPYMGYHQSGTRTIPQRMMLPATGRDLPPRWRIAFAGELVGLLELWMRR